MARRSVVRDRVMFPSLIFGARGYPGCVLGSTCCQSLRTPYSFNEAAPSSFVNRLRIIRPSTTRSGVVIVNHHATMMGSGFHGEVENVGECRRYAPHKAHTVMLFRFRTDSGKSVLIVTGQGSTQYRSGFHPVCDVRHRISNRYT